MGNAAKSTCYWGGQVLHRISEPKVDPIEHGDVTPLVGMSPTNKAYGFRQGLEPSFRITFTTPVMELAADQEVNWAALARAYAEDVFEIEAGGSTLQYPGMCISCVPDVDSDRVTTWTVTIVALYERAV